MIERQIMQIEKKVISMKKQLAHKNNFDKNVSVYTKKRDLYNRGKFVSKMHLAQKWKNKRQLSQDGNMSRKLICTKRQYVPRYNFCWKEFAQKNMNKELLAETVIF